MFSVSALKIYGIANIRGLKKSPRIGYIAQAFAEIRRFLGLLIFRSPCYSGWRCKIRHFNRFDLFVECVGR